MNTTSMKRKLEGAGYEFGKQPAGGWRCYDADSFETVAEHRELGKCVWEAAEKLGEDDGR